jgi:hypothetical protein
VKRKTLRERAEAWTNKRATRGTWAWADLYLAYQAGLRDGARSERRRGRNRANG